MRWIFALLAILLSALVLMPLRFGYFFPVSKTVDLTAKVIPTLMTAGFAAAGCLQNRGDSYAVLVLVALLICSAADVLLGIHFVSGGALFLIAHLFYIAAFAGRQTLHWYHLALVLAAAALLWSFCWRYRPLIPSTLMFAGVLVYALALSALLAFALPLPFVKLSLRSVLAAVGAVLFVISDMGVCHGRLVDHSTGFHYRSLGVYYLAQLCLGMSTFGG